MSSNLVNKKILLGITGGIAAYKSAELVRLLRKQGAEVKVVMTKAAKEFITPLTMQTLSGNMVYDELFKLADLNVEHIALTKWADAILVAPASANFMARLACGFADDLLSTVCLAATCPIAIAPAMNVNMWLNKITQENLEKLLRRGIQVFGPVVGELACGDVAIGKMLEPFDLVNNIADIFCVKKLLGKKILITAGPTQESIDSVRYLSNHSSGKMGYALAEAARDVDAEVVLITGPTNLEKPNGIKVIKVTTAKQMHEAVMFEVKDAQVFIAVAAVADYSPVKVSQQKIKRSKEPFTIEMKPNPDILADVAALPKPPFTIGFAAETESLLANAKEKLCNKKIDMIIANQFDQAVGADDNKVSMLFKNGEIIDLPPMSKKSLAKEILKIAVTL